MNNLHKKIGVGVLSAVLLVGVPVASISFIKSNQSGVSIVEAYSNQFRLPFKRPDELIKAKADQRKIAENDFEIVFGVMDIFNYRIFSVNPGDKPDRWVIVHNEKFKDAMEYLGYLSSNDIKDGMHQFNIGRQVYRIQFYENVKYKQWFLYLHQWLKGYQVELRNYHLK